MARTHIHYDKYKVKGNRKNTNQNDKQLCETYCRRPTVPVRVLSFNQHTHHKVFLRNSGFNVLNVLEISAKAWTNNNNAHNVSMHMD